MRDSYSIHEKDIEIEKSEGAGKGKGKTRRYVDGPWKKSGTGNEKE